MDKIDIVAKVHDIFRKDYLANVSEMAESLFKTAQEILDIENASPKEIFQSAFCSGYERAMIQAALNTYSDNSEKKENNDNKN